MYEAGNLLTCHRSGWYCFRDIFKINHMKHCQLDVYELSIFRKQLTVKFSRIEWLISSKVLIPLQHILVYDGWKLCNQITTDIFDKRVHQFESMLISRAWSYSNPKMIILCLPLNADIEDKEQIRARSLRNTLVIIAAWVAEIVFHENFCIGTRFVPQTHQHHNKYVYAM